MRDGVLAIDPALDRLGSGSGGGPPAAAFLKACLGTVGIAAMIGIVARGDFEMIATDRSHAANLQRTAGRCA